MGALRAVIEQARVLRDQWGKPSRSSFIALLAAAMMLVTALKAPIIVWVRSGMEESWRSVMDWTYYNVSFLSARYAGVGFVRRGLGGTLANILSDDPYVAAFRLHIASALFLIGALATVQYRLLRTGVRSAALFMIIFAVLSPQMFMGWANDIARTDMLVIGTIAWAGIAFTAGRPMASAALLVIGFLIHETAIIFGVPLVFAIAASSLRAGELEVRDLRRAAATLIFALVTIVSIQSFTTPSSEAFSASMLRNTPPPVDSWHADLRDCAIYMMIAGMRGLRTAICYNFYWSAYIVMVIFSVIVTTLNGVVLGLDRRPLWFAFAVFTPMLVMNAVANDSGRWVKFACANAWLLSSVYQRRGQVVLGVDRLFVSSILLALLIYMGSSPVHEVDRASASVVRRLHLAPPPDVAGWMTHCDPQWRKIAHGHVEL